MREIILVVTSVAVRLRNLAAKVCGGIKNGHIRRLPLLWKNAEKKEDDQEDEINVPNGAQRL